MGEAVVFVVTKKQRDGFPNSALGRKKNGGYKNKWGSISQQRTSGSIPNNFSEKESKITKARHPIIQLT